MTPPLPLSRRDLLIAAPSLAFAAQAPKRPRIAAICTVYFKFSHSQHIVDRMLEGYGWNGEHHHPEMDLVSIYVDQFGNTDFSKDRVARFPQTKMYPTIAEALTRGTGKLDVDGILLVGEHGQYAKTEKGQVKYPRYEFFNEIVKVFKSSNRVVPIFNDKHLSWKWEWAKEMYDTAKAMKIPFQAGSSLPVTWRTPSIEMPLNSKIEEAVCVGYGGVDSYDFHALETLQCMVERRKGGETGVKWLEAYRGDRFWQAMKEGVWSRDLMNAALCRSHTLKPSRPGFNDIFPTDDAMKQLVKNPIAYRYDHTDGARSTMILLSGLVEDFNFAARINGQKKPFSTQMYLPMPPGRTTLANFFSPLVNHAEKMFLTGKVQYPLERTLLTTGLTAAGVDSLFAGQKRLETPHLSGITYQPTKESTFWRS